MTDTRDWDQYWLSRANLNASMTTCCRRAVGAVAVRDRRSFADGFNGNLPGTTHCVDGGCERCAGEFPPGTSLDTCVCVHAEANVVSYCAREGIRTAGATMYITHSPCLECMKLIVSAGFVEVVYDEYYPVAVDVDNVIRHRRFV